MQDAWKLQLDWDDYLPDDIVNLWAQFKKEIGYLSQVMIPRYLAIIPKEDEVRMQLHGFADASAKAYAAVCYLRCETQNDVKIQLLAAKTRVASLKAPTLPCLELCAAHLLSQLVDSIKLTLPLQIKETFLWTDSKITLCWIQSNPSKWKVYISNRVEKIQKPQELINGIMFQELSNTDKTQITKIPSLKFYIALFVCFATKAIHLELVSDLSTGSFIAALRRFTSRRGTPSDIYSDNGTNFKGAAKFLNEQYALLQASEIQNYITYSEINWHFMPPHAPYFGGIWESNIKSVKMILKKVIGSSLLTFEELTTFLTQNEATLNQRSLTPLSEDPNDLEALTPAHFLSIRGKWKSAKPNVKIGDLVLIMEKSISSSSWIIGRVSKTFHGPDMLVRTVELRTGKGLLRRPVNKVAVLPVQSDLTLTTGPAETSQCWMYYFEWQKRGLPHAHILIWLIDKITPDQIDQVISAEIPDIAIDPDLFEVVAKNMIHAENVRERAASPPQTTLTAFFSLCKGDLFAKTLRYSDVPKYYTWNASEKRFLRRKQGKPVEGHPNIYSSDALGRLYSVHPSNQECFYLRLLLVNVCGQESFQELRTVNGKMGLCAPNRSANDSYDRDLQRETHFDVDDLSVFVERNLSKLVPEQRIAYETLMHAISDQRGELYFLDAPGGTGKTFLINLILATIRSRNEIAVAIALSGIAATLLDSGRTAHSALKLPLNLHTIETPTCNISKISGMGKVLQTCKLIIWYECKMAHKKGLEALDRTLKDLRANGNSFGGALILLSGDFRQTLPVIPRSTPADELNACLKSSVLWPQVKNLMLKTNMRVHLQNDAPAERFAKQLLNIGNGKMTIDPTSQCITLPTSFCTLSSSKEELIQKRTYTSFDTVLNEDEAVNYPTEFLNCLDLPGFPPHVLQLKTGVPIILLRNINPPKLCNGTRLSVKTMMNNIIEATILNGKFKGQDVLLPRIPLFPPDLPFEFKRLQFPVRTAFSMTINKAQGQSLKVCGLNLEVPCFSHEQLYVASSRVGNPSNLYVYTPDKTGTYTCKSSNGLLRYLHLQQLQWFIQVPTPETVPMVYAGTYTCNSSNGLCRYLHLQQFQWFIKIPTPATVTMVYSGTYTCNSSNGLCRYLHLKQFQWFMQIVQMAQSLGGEGFDYFTNGDIVELMADKELSEDDLINLVCESESDKSDEEELVPVTFNAKVIREGLALGRKLGNNFMQNTQMLKGLYDSYVT
ncbi:hypothetical protein LAZ67_23000609 [Cordylochernes scorpioides]|uniref:ATP-dependent DNA helicase n=1 Tax=Cordylochernes scorpioides TaxID=51811 RepID=A0ABY6LQH6_9ARAC|nr:hypothetical protein LAZ67_23000609 [Cordylochernes scorpioides]